MNTPTGLNKVLEWNQSIEILLDSIDNVNILSQAEILMVMAGLCFLSADAHVYVKKGAKRRPKSRRPGPLYFFWLPGLSSFRLLALE